MISSLKCLLHSIDLLMSDHQTTGSHGESMAVSFLTGKGYSILKRNWRHANWEIDIIAEKNGLLHFVEVKTRRTPTFGYPEDDVSKKKFKHLVNAAEEFLFQFPRWKIIQFDIISIIITKGEPEFFFIEDVYL